MRTFEIRCPMGSLTLWSLLKLVLFVSLAQFMSVNFKNIFGRILDSDLRTRTPSDMLHKRIEARNFTASVEPDHTTTGTSLDRDTLTYVYKGEYDGATYGAKFEISSDRFHHLGFHRTAYVNMSLDVAQKFVVVSAAGAGYVTSALNNMVGSLYRYMPERPIVVYDLGMTAAEVARVCTALQWRHMRVAVFQQLDWLFRLTKGNIKDTHHWPFVKVIRWWPMDFSF